MESRKKIEGHGRFCVDIKTLTPPLPLPYRGGESIARGQIVYDYLENYPIYGIVLGKMPYATTPLPYRGGELSTRRFLVFLLARARGVFSNSGNI